MGMLYQVLTDASYGNFAVNGTQAPTFA